MLVLKDFISVLKTFRGTALSVLLPIDLLWVDNRSGQHYLCVINWRYVQRWLNCLLPIVSTHTGSVWQVHYLDCHLTICLYDRQPQSFAIDGGETHRSITLWPPAAFKSSPAHRWTCWVLLDRIRYWLHGSQWQSHIFLCASDSTLLSLFFLHCLLLGFISPEAETRAVFVIKALPDKSDSTCNSSNLDWSKHLSQPLFFFHKFY